MRSVIRRSPTCSVLIPSINPLAVVIELSAMPLDDQHLRLKSRAATLSDCAELGELNRQLIEAEGHRNPMNAAELAERMRGWLASDYTGIIFEIEELVVAYALYREEAECVYLRQFLVTRNHRRNGIGRMAMAIVRQEVWSSNKRLVVEVLSGNGPAIAFWKAVGFREYSLALEIVPEG